MNMPWYSENLDYLAAVTRMLNETSIPESDDFYIHIELREADTHRKVGEWTDEIAADAWSFSEAS